MPDLTREKVEELVKQWLANYSYHENEVPEDDTYFRVLKSWLTLDSRVRELEGKREALLTYWDKNFPLNIQVVDKLAYYVEKLREEETRG